MGLSAAQARYLFISNRTNQIENSLMKISNKQLILADKADEIAYQKSIAENTKVWSLNGLNDIGYNELMGDTALTNNQLNLITTNNGADSKIVLDNRYANAVRAAAISNDGGAFSDSSYGKFLSKLGFNPKGEIGSWANYTNGVDIITTIPSYTESVPNEALLEEAINFREQYGSTNFNGRIRSESPAPEAEVLAQHYLDFQQYVYDYQMEHDHFFYSTYSMQQFPYTELREQIPGIYFDDNKQPRAGVNFTRDVENDFTYLRANITTQFDNNDVSGLLPMMLSTLRAINSFITDGTHQYQEAANNVDLYYLLEGLVTPFNGQPINPNSKFGDPRLDETTTIRENEKGYIQDEWNAAFNALPADVRAFLNNWTFGASTPPAPTMTVTIPEKTTVRHVNGEDNPIDKATYERYKTLFINICETGWTEDAGVQDKKTLIAKLENATYFVNSALISSKENSQFTKVALSSKINIDTWYDNQIKKIKEEEQSLESKSQLLQTQLIALSTEEESVKAIIDKNIERSFNLFG